MYNPSWEGSNFFPCSNTAWHHFSLEPLMLSEERRTLKETSHIKNPTIMQVLQIKSWADNMGSLKSHPLFDLNAEFSHCYWNFINNCLLLPIGRFCLLVIFAVLVAPGCKLIPFFQEENTCKLRQFTSTQDLMRALGGSLHYFYPLCYKK